MAESDWVRVRCVDGPREGGRIKWPKDFAAPGQRLPFDVSALGWDAQGEPVSVDLNAYVLREQDGELVAVHEPE